MKLADSLTLDLLSFLSCIWKKMLYIPCIALHSYFDEDNAMEIFEINFLVSCWLSENIHTSLIWHIILFLC